MSGELRLKLRKKASEQGNIREKQSKKKKKAVERGYKKKIKKRGLSAFTLELYKN